jgi:hypothetical protein
MRGAATRSRVVSIVVSSMVGLAVACGGGVSGGTTITVHTGAPPALIAFRDGADAPWQTPMATAPGLYEITVHGAYTVAAVCVSGESAATRARSLTPEDPTDVDLSCLLEPSSPESHVTGTTVNLTFGSVEIGHALGTITTAAPQFDLVVPDGTYDVIARLESGNAAERIAFRRHLVVAGPTTVMPAIDVAAEGTATIAVTPTVTNLAPGETLALLGELTAGATSSDVEFPSLGVVHVLPDAALLPTDVQRIQVAALMGGTSTRSVARRYSQGASLQFTLPPPSAAQFVVTGDQLALQWTSLSPADTLQVVTNQATADRKGSVQQSRELSAHYLAATGVTRAALDTDLPGYAAAWRVDVTRPWTRIGGTTRTDPGGDELFTSLTENLTPVAGGPARVEPGSHRTVWRPRVR